MYIYYILLFGLIISGLICHFLEKRYKKSTSGIRTAFLWISLILLTLVEGLRGYTVGSDTISYTEMFATHNFPMYFEQGFICFTNFLYLFNDNPTFYLIACSLLANGLVLWAIKKLSVNPYLSVYFFVTLYYYFGSFNGIRQYIAIGFLLHAFIFAIDQKWIKYFITLVLAYSFHHTAFVGLIFIYYFFFPIDKSYKMPITANIKEKIFIFLTILTAMALYYKFDILISGVTSVFVRYGEYQSLDYFTHVGGIQQIIVYGSILFAFSFLVPSYDKMKKALFLPLCISVLLSILQFRSSLLGRMIWYFDIFSIFALSYLLTNNRLDNIGKKILYISVIGITFAFMTYYLMYDYQQVGRYYFQ